MREILFRGKRLDNLEWAYGWYEMYPFGKWPVKTSIIPSEEAKSGHYEHVEVYPSTVGQYTGLKDKNGKRIFEGDIIKSDNGEQSSISVVKFGEYYPKMFYVMMDIYFPIAQHINANGFFAESTKHEDMILFKSPFFEIIGNVHDNPELLEK